MEQHISWWEGDSIMTKKGHKKAQTKNQTCNPEANRHEESTTSGLHSSESTHTERSVPYQERNMGSREGEQHLKSVMDIDERFIKALLELRNDLPPTREALDAILHEFQNMKALALKTIEHNAFLTGKAEAESKQGSYSQSFSAGCEQNNMLEFKRALLIKDVSGTANPQQEIRAKLKNFEPIEFGITDVDVKNIKDGVAVIADKVEDLRSLESGLKANQETRHFFIRISEGLSPEVKIVGVDLGVNENEIPERIFKQNNLNGNEEEVKIVWVTKKESSKSVTLRISNRELANEMVKRGHVNIGWTRCRVYENVLVSKCSRCARFGHIEKQCRSRGVRCTECGGAHYYSECQAETKSCPVCKEKGYNYKKHSMWDATCLAFDEAYESQRRRMGFVS
ncbi:uncharacterized protein LOC142563355 [Dermacentor variabilis]|uniref:uncharacterized protein LOC142563355 n=1 Tax=Dermacentor variabilis TaxID=34621 RepID=UPI003F5C01AE